MMTQLEKAITALEKAQGILNQAYWPHDARHPTMWGLADLILELKTPIQEPVKSPKTGTLVSSYGEVTFNSVTGEVISVTHYSGGPGYLCDVTKVDVKEWEHTYPGEDPAQSHDILDFGTWSVGCGSSLISYDPPCYGWREDRRDMLEGEIVNKCPKCGKLHEGYFSRIEPMGYHCEHCGARL